MAPRQRRGEARVEAILVAAAELFEERGVEAVTMSDVAARSATAFGSLYRFFPSKEALSDALLQRYAQHTFERLEDLQARAGEMSPRDLAASLVQLVRDLSAARRSSLSLLEWRPAATGGKWANFLGAFRRHLGAVIQAPASLADERRDAESAVCLTLLTGVARALRESAAESERIITEHEDALAVWLGSLK